MIWAILFYYFVIIVALYLWWLIFFCTYYTKDNDDWHGTWKKGDKVTYSLWELLVSFPLAFIPVINIFAVIVAFFYMEYIRDIKKAEIRSFLFKKL